MNEIDHQIIFEEEEKTKQNKKFYKIMKIDINTYIQCVCS